ncbi:hypothetical protein QLX67_12095, partial [Balneolaceae bacterium ANBcel3]|nr:hypothetical protein [Balneolaceae bacterium ANBcel3]
MSKKIVWGLFMLLVAAGSISCSIFGSDSKNDKEDPVIEPIDIEPGEVITIRSISIHEVTFHFDQEYTAGTFANGDFWVLGPVVIDRITPDFDGENYGWEV